MAATGPGNTAGSDPGLVRRRYEDISRYIDVSRYIDNIYRYLGGGGGLAAVGGHAGAGRGGAGGHGEHHRHGVDRGHRPPARAVQGDG